MKGPGYYDVYTKLFLLMCLYIHRTEVLLLRVKEKMEMGGLLLGRNGDEKRKILKVATL